MARRVEDPRVKSRPTYHYRLPDADLSDPSWTAVTEWNRWVGVERLADDEAALKDTMRRFVSALDEPVLSQWIERIRGRNDT